ncbi:MAG TPA: sigma 54-interacting transcriptional regulator [Acidobacteriota bacterium]|nr:sigma 54-interacting transcriptional regulator [Acidobacteriota bacterium]
MNQPSSSEPRFDWQTEQTGQKRDLSRFTTELGRVLVLRGSSASAKKTAARVRERWENLVRRIEGRWARGREGWDRLTEWIERLQSERTLLDGLVAYDERLEAAPDIETILEATLQVVTVAVPGDGAMVDLLDLGGQSRQVVTERRRGRKWPAVGDRDLARRLAAGAGEGTRIVIEGRPVGAAPRDQGRAAHWLAVGVIHEGAAYGAIVVGRRATDDGFTDANVTALARIARRLGRALAARVGVGVRPVLGAGPKPDGFEHLWGESPAFRRALAMAARFALSDSPVVIEGELGTGRETLARAMHSRSPRASHPFVVFRGTDLPEDIVARQMFGVVDHAADGTVSEHPGDLDLAEGGTLYIDELADLDLVAQVRLVRLLNEGTFERIGERRERTAGVRLVAATAVNLEEAVARGRVREDLYYQITGARITLPPLRERAGDIAELARRFAIAYGTKAGKTVEGIDSEAARVLAAARFPGNVQQLAHVIERAVYLAGGSLVGAADLPGEVGAPVVAAPVDATGWVEQAATAIRQALAAGSAGDYQAFRRARRQGEQAVEGAFTAAVHKAVGRHPSRAAEHCRIHRAQWWRLVRSRGGADRAADAGDETNRIRNDKR